MKKEKGQMLVPFKDKNGESHDNYYVDVATGIIYFRKTHNGKRIKFSTLEKSIVKAKRYANQEFDRRTGKGPRVKITTLINDELDQWSKIKEAEGLKPDTLKNVRNAIVQIRPYWGEKFPREITRDNLLGWYDWFAKTYPDQQMENAIKYKRNFCRYLAQKVVDGVPLLPAIPDIKDPKYKDVRASRKKKKARIFTKDEFKAVYEAGRGIEKVISLFMYTMASRVDETLNLRFGEEILLDVDPPVYRWSVGQNKADHWGSHALHPALIEPLKRLRRIRKRQGTDRLFPQRRDNTKALREQMIDWDGWRARADLGWHWTSHIFRHTCLSNLFNDERNPQALILKLYRVSLAVALETYIKPTQSGILKMRNAIEVVL